MKRCGKCGNELPLEDFYVDRRSNDGRTYACKPCVKATNAESKAKVPIEVKRERWRKENNSEAGKRRDVRWRENNPEKWSAIQGRTKANRRDKSALEWAAWYAVNRDKVLAQRRAKYDAEKKRLSRDPVAGARYSAERRARMAGLPTEKIDRNELYERDNGTCQICNESVPEKGWELDHIIPIVHGGPHLWHNVQVLCRTCNRRKGKRLADETVQPAA